MPNSQTIRSQKWITEALLSLMETKPFDKITITEICEKADVVRRTFYRYYKSKEDLLQSYLHSICLGYVNDLCTKGLPDESAQSIVYNFFVFWGGHKELFSVLSRNNELATMTSIYEEFIPVLNARFFSKLRKNYSDRDIEYYCEFVIGGLWRVFVRWMELGTKESPEEMAQKLGMILSFQPDKLRKDN